MKWAISPFRRPRLAKLPGSNLLSAAGHSFAGLVYPPQCVWCRSGLPDPSENIMLCDACRELISPPVPGWCFKCSAPIRVAPTPSNDCPHCSGEAFPWQRAVGLGQYRGELSSAVRRTKSSRSGALTMALSRLLLDRRAEVFRDFQTEVIVPMPMHWVRRMRRGVNGPAIIAEVLAGRLRQPLAARSLFRHRLTSLQTELSPSQRHRNQRNSFRTRHVRRLAGRRILLVDDVLTTGATASEAAQTLLIAGAAAVFVAVLARGIGDEGR